MSGKNYQIAAYAAGRPLKHHEERMLELVQQADAGVAESVLDIGCADGTFLAAVKASLPHLHCVGMDYSQQLIRQGRERFTEIDLQVGDASEMSGYGGYDIVIASGILGVFDDMEAILKGWLGHVKPHGTLLMFGRFNTADIDTIIHFRVGSRAAPWEGGWSALSLRTISEIADAAGFSVEFERFVFPGRLPKSDNPVKTYNIVGDDGETYMVCRGNVIAEQYFAVFRRQ